jgi:hypothetical protein
MEKIHTQIDRTEEARQLAQNSSTPAELLRKLSISSDFLTRKHVAENPNTPTEVLLKLGAEFPEQLLDNPVFSLLLLENPNLVDTMPATTLASLLKHERVPIFFLEKAANSRDREVLLALAMNPQTSKTVLEKLIQSPYNKVKEAAQLHVNWAGEITEGWDEAARQAIWNTTLVEGNNSHVQKKYGAYLEELAKIGAIPDFILKSLPQNDSFFQELATNPNTPEKSLEFLARSDNWEIRLGVASNSSTSEKILEELARDSNLWIREEVARHSNTPKSVLKQLAERAKENYEDSEVLAELAEFSLVRDREVVPTSSTTEGNLEALVRDSNWDQRLEVAQNPDTPEIILEQLAKDDELWVRLGVAGNPKTPRGILNNLVEDNYALPNQTLTIDPKICISYLAGNNHALISKKIAVNPNVNVSLLSEILTPDAEFWIGLEVAGNPNTPAFILEKLAKVGDDMMFRKLASNPNTPTSVLLQLVGNEDFNVRQNLALNPNTPTSVIEQLLVDRESVVRAYAVARYLAQNPEGLPMVLKYCPKDSTTSFNRLLILLHPQIPGKILTENCRSEVWVERYAIAQHTNTPVDTLKTLALDANRIVRAAARSNLQTRN